MSLEKHDSDHSNDDEGLSMDTDLLEVYEDWEKIRKPLLAINNETIKGVFNEYVQKGSSVLEIGSGLGRLAKALDDRRTDIQQTEYIKAVAKANERLNGMEVKVADAYQLPFEDVSYDVITANCVFDVLTEPEKALKEAKRVLKDRGLFIHLQDMQPSNTTIYEKYRDSDYVPIPAINQQGSTIGLRLFPKEEFINISISKMPNVADFFRDFVSRPDYWYRKLKEDFVASNNTAMMLLVYLTQILPQFTSDTEVVDYQSFFFNNLKNAVNNCGMQIIEFGKREGKPDVKPRNSFNIQHARERFNVVHHDVGTMRLRYDPSLDSMLSLAPYEAVKVESSIHVIVAKK